MKLWSLFQEETQGNVTIGHLLCFVFWTLLRPLCLSTSLNSGSSSQLRCKTSRSASRSADPSWQAPAHASRWSLLTLSFPNSTRLIGWAIEAFRMWGKRGKEQSSASLEEVVWNKSSCVVMASDLIRAKKEKEKKHIWHFDREGGRKGGVGGSGTPEGEHY